MYCIPMVFLLLYWCQLYCIPLYPWVFSSTVTEIDVMHSIAKLLDLRWKVVSVGKDQLIISLLI
jgi:hypothetical protein